MKLFLSLVIAFIIIGIGHVVNGDQSNGGDKTMPGGWSSVSVDDGKIVAAAKHAVSAQAAEANEKLTLLEIKKAHQQVVAGMNYRLTLRVERNGKKQSASAVVWLKLDGTYKLTEWKWK
jgi:hypothetical protein